MKPFFGRLGRTIICPAKQIDRLLRNDDGDVMEPLWFFIFIISGVNFLALYQATLFFEQRPFWVLQKLFSLVAFHGQSIFLFLAVWVLLFYGAARLFLGKSLPLGHLFHGTSYLLNIFSILIALGAALAFAGFDHWSLPHHPVHSTLIWEKGHLMWSRYASKCAVTYGLPTLIGLKILWQWRKRVLITGNLPSSRWGMAVITLFSVLMWAGSLGHTYQKLDILKPVLVGDNFPKHKLPFLKARPSDPTGSYDFGAATDLIRVVDFWASWCGPCRKGLPKLEKIGKDYKNKRVMVIGVNREPQDLPSAQAVLSQMAPEFVSVVDSGRLARAVGVQVLPTTFVLMPSGEVTFVHMGALDETALRAAIDASLNDLDH